MSQMNKILILCSSFVIPLIFSISHTGEKPVILVQENQMAAKPIVEVFKEHAKTLMSIPGIVGTGQGICEGKSCVKVFVIKKTPELEGKILKTLEAYPVVIEGEEGTIPQSIQLIAGRTGQE